MTIPFTDHRAARPLTTRLFGGLAAVMLVFTTACSDSAKPKTLLDAADIFTANQAVFESIRGAYPGPYDGFSRLPPRDPTTETPADKAFLKALRKNIPVDYVDFFPIGDGGGDEMDIVLNRFASNERWNTISIIYFSKPLTLSEEYRKTMRLFEYCDERALNWLNGRRQAGPAAAFCRLNASWYAYQRID